VDQAVTALELETMLLARHLTLSARRNERSLEQSAYTILTCLTCGGPMSIGELSDAIGLEFSTLTRQTAAMRSADLIERIPDPEGGMARKLRPTPDGRARLADACRSSMSLLTQATADWSAEDIQTFAIQLERFNRSIERLDNHAWPRPGRRSIDIGDGLSPTTHVTS
jgi:transcriptional regulator, MarR family